MEKIEVIAAAYMKKIREINCKESTSPSEQKSASFLIGRPHSPRSLGRVRTSHFKSSFTSQRLAWWCGVSTRRSGPCLGSTWTGQRGSSPTRRSSSQWYATQDASWRTCASHSGVPRSTQTLKNRLTNSFLSWSHTTATSSPSSLEAVFMELPCLFPCYFLCITGLINS